MQQYEGKIEFIIADDNSPDNTESIVNSFANHPNYQRIKYIKNDINIGMHANFRNALSLCQGEFIALCDGDDYWIDPLKLNKQIEFAVTNDLIGVFTDYEILRNKRLEQREYPFSIPLLKEEKTIVRPQIIPNKNFHFSHTSTFLFRRSIIEKTINHVVFERSFGIDEIILLEILANGHAGYINSVTSIKRINPTSTTNWERNAKNIKKIYTIKLSAFKAYYNLYPFYKKQIKYKIMENKLKLTRFNKRKIFENIVIFIYFLRNKNYKNLKKMISYLRS